MSQQGFERYTRRTTDTAHTVIEAYLVPTVECTLSSNTQADFIFYRQEVREWKQRAKCLSIYLNRLFGSISLRAPPFVSDQSVSEMHAPAGVTLSAT